jgi:hypothetical protein
MVTRLDPEALKRGIFAPQSVDLSKVDPIREAAEAAGVSLNGQRTVGRAPTGGRAPTQPGLVDVTGKTPQQLQKERAQRQRERVQAQRELTQQLRGLSPRERVDLRQAITAQRLIERGRTPSPQSQQALQRVLAQQETRSIITQKRPQSTVEIAPTTRQQLDRQIREATPELEILGRSQQAQFIRNLIGVVAGTATFGKEKLVGQLTEAKDITGKRIFTPTQARKTVDLAGEVASSALLGAGVGKGVTIGRGAVRAVLPKVVKESPKLQKAARIGNIALAAGLTAVEAKNIQKTLQEEGEDAALLRLVGFASFGAGFAKTGLKPGTVAEREAKNLVKNLKRTIPKGKKGQAALRKKVGKNRFEKLKQLDKGRNERLKNIKAKVEKRIAKAKDIREQLNILSDLKKQAKTKNQKEGFKRFVRELVEKEVIKLPKVEIKPAEITVRRVVSRRRPRIIEPEPIIKKPKVVTKARRRNIQRVQQARRQQLKSRQKAAVALGVKYTQAQVQRGRQRQSQRQKVGLRFRPLLAQTQPPIQKQKPVFGRPTRPVRDSKGRRIPSPLFKPPIVKKRKPKRIVEKKKPIIPPSKIGYNVLGKPLKKKRFVKLNQVPLTKAKARDLGAFLADRSLARTFKLKQTGKVAKKPKLKIPASYYSRTRKKFRDFRRVKGKKIKLRNKFIEKKGKPLLDTRAERERITLLAQLARLKKKSKIKRRKK